MMGVTYPSVIVIHADRRCRGNLVQPGNQKCAIAIVCVNGEGVGIPPFLVNQGVYHLSNWYT